MRPGNEHARAPVGRAEREAPFGGREAGFELAHLKQSHRGRRPCGTTAKNVIAGRPFGAGPGNEPLEAGHVVGGGEMKRDTSSVVSSANSDGASESFSSRSVTLRAGQHRQLLRQSVADRRGVGRWQSRCGLMAPLTRSWYGIDSP